MELLDLLDALQLGEERFTVDLPKYITDSINPKFEIREYQKQAVNRFEYVLNTYKKRKKPTNMLFQMATGSGKTLVMACCILQLYKQGYRSFIFFVDSTNIIEKTKDNFLNTLSSKYLFNKQIQFDDKKVSIKPIQNFANADNDCINIHFSTIQGLHSNLNNPKENSLTYEDFENRQIVLLSDEAHHMNVDTLRDTGKQLKIKEFEQYDSWETTAMRIFNSNKENLLLEFTATAELHEPAIAKKYNNSLIFDYSLKKFYLAKYSKEVNVLQSSLSRIERALQAIVLSQYRYLVFAKNGLAIKPVVMFKSNLVNIPKQRDEDKVVSSEFKAEFLNKINNLQVSDLEHIRNNTQANGIIRKAFEFFYENGTSLENLVLQLQESFSEEKTISVDSTTEKEKTQLIINSLEEPSNAIRAIFAVDALNEGWDVLNLFDIVRLYNTRDAKSGNPGKATMSEAQLIGRGARYCPFQLNDGQPKFQRKFDDDLKNPLRICEELYYHSQTNSRYIDELNKALDKIGIKPRNLVVRQHKLKAEFTNSKFYNSGIIYINSQNKYRNDEVTEFPEYLKNKKFTFKQNTTFSAETTLIEKNTKTQKEYLKTLTIKSIELGMNIFNKATHKLPFYTFSNLKKYYPNINSITEFLSSEKYLNSCQIEIFGKTSKISDLTQNEKLECAIKFLNDIQPEIEKGNVQYKGSEVFTPHGISNIFYDKEMNFVLRESGDAETGQSMKAPQNNENFLDLSYEKWYAFADNFGTSEEKKLILFIKNAIDKLEKRYSQIYLMRNEKYFQIYRFSDGKAFEPDFVLFLKELSTDETIIYQLFIEPKGGVFMEMDKWKENFLLEIEDKHIIHQDLNYKLIGLPFFNNQNPQKREFSLVFDKYL